MAGKTLMIPKTETHHFVEGKFIEFILRPLTSREIGPRLWKKVRNGSPAR
jgi:hypothetical protein